VHYQATADRAAVAILPNNSKMANDFHKAEEKLNLIHQNILRQNIQFDTVKHHIDNTRCFLDLLNQRINQKPSTTKK